ncbi:MAG: antibiotic biosynthesis monooxygenase [bacterium]
MIARIWRGRTPSTKADEYFEYLKKTGLKDVRSTTGNQGVYILRRLKGGEAEFLFLSLWDSMAAIKLFAGDDSEKARYYPEDKNFLLEMEPVVSHYEILAKP